METPTRSFWLSEPSEIHELRSTWIEVADVVIIGTGITAASLAQTLYTNGSQLTIVLIDARGLASDSTGRDGGHIKPSVYVEWSELKAKYGVEETIHLTDFEDGHLAEVSSFMTQKKIKCDLHLQ